MDCDMTLVEVSDSMRKAVPHIAKLESEARDRG